MHLGDEILGPMQERGGEVLTCVAGVPVLTVDQIAIPDLFEGRVQVQPSNEAVERARIA